MTARAPIAVLGMGCRFPGAEGADAYFDGSQYLVCGLGPFEGLPVVVVLLDEPADIGLELSD
jgi:hypothetical protein